MTGNCQHCWKETNKQTKIIIKTEGWGRDGLTIQYLDFYLYPVLEWHPMHALTQLGLLCLILIRS